MQIYAFSRQGVKPVLLDSVDRLPEEGFIWLDFTRDEASSWPAHVEPLVQASIHDTHLEDSFSNDHPSYFDTTEDYDVLIFQGLTPGDCALTENLIVTKSATFFLFDRLLVSVHADENVSFDIVKRKFCETKLRFPSTPVGMVYVILDTMVDRYLMITDELEKRLERAQLELMDAKSGYQDWQELLNYRKQGHDLEVLCGQNLEAVEAWKREMRVDISEKQRSRLNDLREHILRVQSLADSLQKNIEVAVQLYFAAVSFQTNRIMRTLTVMSAIFFPLTLITGIYGMNFHNMPELSWHFGYFIVLGILAVSGIGLVWAFKRRGFF